MQAALDTALQQSFGRHRIQIHVLGIQFNWIFMQTDKCVP